MSETSQRWGLRLAGPGMLIALVVASGGEPPEVAAQAAKRAPGAGPGCVIEGVTEMPPNLEIYDASSGGSAFAKFTGAKTTIKATSFPASTSERVGVETGTGSGGFRLKGYTDGAKLPLYTKKLIQAKRGHVWINEAREVSFQQAKPGRLKVAKQVTSPMNQTFSGWGSCSDFTFTQGTTPAAEIEGKARAFVVKKDEVTLWSHWKKSERDEVVTLHNNSSHGIVFWSTKSRNGWVQIHYHGEVVIEAWAKWNDLKPLPRGELQDELIPPQVKRSAPRLKVQGTPKNITTTKEHVIRIEPKQDGREVGVLEKNTETLVIDIVAGWASVLPKKLDVVPAGTNQFWVKADELGVEVPLPIPKKKPDDDESKKDSEKKDEKGDN